MANTPKGVIELFDLEGKTALVTGGSSGIGFSIADILTKSGVKVAIAGRNAEKCRSAVSRLRESGVHVEGYPADVTRKDEVEALTSAIEQQLGPISILVNSAGINIRKKALEFNLDEWNEILNINLTGTFLTSQTVGRRMIARRAGKIVNISSVAAAIGLTDRAPYCASKGGVSQLTKVLAIEWAPYGVTVNAIGPGFIRTQLISDLMKDPEFQSKVERLVPMQRVGETHDLHGVLVVLCSKAGDYITGQTIYVDGGWSIW